MGKILFLKVDTLHFVKHQVRWSLSYGGLHNSDGPWRSL